MQIGEKIILFWAILVLATICIGIASRYYLRKPWGAIFSALVPWSIFLVINLLGIGSRDRELTQDSWPTFQLLYGSVLALLGYLSGWIFEKKARTRRN